MSFGALHKIYQRKFGRVKGAIIREGKYSHNRVRRLQK